MSSKHHPFIKADTNTSDHTNWSSRLIPFFPYIATFLAMCIFYCHLFSKNLLNNEAVICLCMRTVLLILVLYGAFLAFQHKLTMDHLIWLCIVGGFVMRIGYAFYTPYYIRQHDLGSLSETDTGHAAYIYNLYLHHRLPSSYNAQFYHPPLFHTLAALILSFFTTLYPNADINNLFESVKLVSCFSSCSILLLVRSLCRELKVKPGMTCIAISILSFQPNFYLLAGRINNDATATALMVFSLLMLVRWYHSRHFSHLMGMAFGIGLGMMTKLNAAIVTFVAAPVMLYIFWQAIQKKAWKKLFMEYVGFLAICAPLGLWYSIRNYILFQQPLGYVLNLDTNGPSWLYRGNYSITQRFLSFPWDQFHEHTYCDPGTDYNVPLYLLRCSLFGEFSFENMDKIARMMIHVNILLILLSLIAMVVTVWKGTQFSPFLRYGAGLVWLITGISYITFNIKYPDSCTMDFRYILPTVICGSVYLAAFWQQMYDYTAEGKKAKNYIPAKTMVWGIPVCCCIFSLLSAYMFSNLS